VKELIDLHQFKFTVIAEETFIKTELVRFAVLTTPLLGIHIFWDVKPCQLVNIIIIYSSIFVTQVTLDMSIIFTICILHHL